MNLTVNGGRVPDIWIRAFWGFAPWEDGYIGWTRPADRDRMLTEATDGDLIVIYGADSPETAKENRRQVLGILQISLQPIMDVDKCSNLGRQRKIDNGWTDRWTYALPIRRAWQIERKIELRHLAHETYTPNRARMIAGRGAKLTNEEAAAILQLPVTEVDVFGEAPIGEMALQDRPILEAFQLSRGITPGFGTRESDYADGAHKLYLMKYEGPPASLLGDGQRNLHRKSLVKVGFSNDPVRRCAELNASIPPAAQHRWALWLISAEYPSGKAAKIAEDALKADLASKCESLGGEFFLGEETILEVRFASAPQAAAITIRAR